MTLARIKSLRRLLTGLDGFLVTNMVNVRYLSGFTGSFGFLMITRKAGGGNVLVTDFRYAEQSAAEAVGWEVRIFKTDMRREVRSLAARLGIRTIGFENSAPYSLYEALGRAATHGGSGEPRGGLRLRPMDGVVEKLRARKDALEVRAIGMAVRRAEAAFSDIRPHIRAGVSEAAVALRLEEALRRRGSRRVPFDIIVASGPNSALPHAKPTQRKLGPGDLVVVDWGAEAGGGYVSDMTRTLLVKGGGVSDGLAKKKKIYALVLKARSEALKRISAGVSARKIDNYSRDIIKKEGYGEHFGHGLGHGVGLEVHERPQLSWRNPERLAEGMVVTVEPGIYLPGFGGVRVEDMVQVREKGVRMLTSLPRSINKNTV